MSFFDRTAYLRALFVLLPFGLVGLYFGISGLMEKESDLIKYKGVASNVRIGNMYRELAEKFTKAYQVKIEGSDEVFRTHFTKDIDILEPNLKVGDTIILWTRKESFEIVKLQRGEEILIPFNPTTGMDLFILLLGIIFTTLSVAYIIKYPEDLLFGGDREKLMRWWNGKLW